MTDCGPLIAQDIERYLIIYLFLSPLSTELDKLYAWIFYTIGRTRLAVTISNYVSGITKPLFKKTESHEDIENGHPIDEITQRMDELYNRVSAIEDREVKEKADRVLADRVLADRSGSDEERHCLNPGNYEGWNRRSAIQLGSYPNCGKD
uniref:Uncharacterized protein n=1 Tax=Acrobeloides nanus TaxID=290746 RepID=A0A914E4W9_9BILA